MAYVSDCSGCHSKIPADCVASAMEIISSQFGGLEVQAQVLVGLVSGKAKFIGV